MPENRHSYTALITDGLWRKSLSVIRSLGSSGFDLTVMGDSIFTIGFWSRFTGRRTLAPTAANNKEEFGKRLVLELERISRRNLRVALFPMEDASVMWIANNIEKIEGLCSTLLPSLDSLNIAQSKAETIKAARGIGLPCPDTQFAETPDDFMDIMGGMKDKDFVVKPCHGAGSSGIIYGESGSAEYWGKYFEKYGPLVVQERIPREGEGLGACLLMDREGECVASFAHKRLREYPVSGGPSTDRVSIHAPELIEMSINLLRKLSWRGVAMVEWKMDPRDGTPKLMEINPRFWGSLELAVRSGVDFPVLYAKAALGEKIRPVHNYALGVRCRWILGDILRYMNRGCKHERISEFLEGFFTLSEEWNKRDIRGWLAAWLCLPGLALDPRYWKYIRRH